jgi:DNA-directed RNA polymerase III subunit RPC4
MPPRAARGAARGRGRGRGKAPAAPEDLPDAPVILPPRGNGDSSQSTAAASSQPDAPGTIMTTPQHQLNEDAEPSPNSSPATIPTETPAPTPARPTQPDSSEPIVAHTGRLSGRGGRPGVRGGTEKPAAPSRFKPKNIRTDRRVLEERAINEQERLAAIAAESRAEEARLMRGRGRPLRGRGDAMGSRPKPKTTASGIFGALPEMNSKLNGFNFTNYC